MSIAFKEWRVICDALAAGRQSILLRKGGIHEGREGFSFAHRSFHLFPTKFHAQAEHVREGRFAPEKEWEVGDHFSITHHAETLFAVTLTDWAQVEALQPYHIYTEETLRERFDWEGKGMASGSIHLALVRVSALNPPRSNSPTKPVSAAAAHWLKCRTTILPGSKTRKMSWDKISSPLFSNGFQGLQT